MKKIICTVIALVMLLSMAAIAEDAPVFKVGICNYVDDASLNQIVENIEAQLDAIGQEQGVTFEIDYQNCNADNSVMQQIIANFIADEVDLMVGIATPVAMNMQAMTEDNQIPVVFSAVSDPLNAELKSACDALDDLYRRYGKVCYDIGAGVDVRDEAEALVVRIRASLLQVAELTAQRDAAQWSMLGEWASGMTDSFRDKNGLEPASYGNSEVEMLISRAAWEKGADCFIFLVITGASVADEIFRSMSDSISQRSTSSSE